MGEIRVKALLRNEGDVFLHEQGNLDEEKIRTVEVDALVDTGAVMVLLPQDLIEKLGLRKFGKAIVALANEEKVELDRAGTVAMTIGDRQMKMDCLVGPPRCEPLIGQLVLEGLDLIPDPLKRTLTPRPESPFLPSLKLK